MLDAIVIDELQPQAGKVYITGTVISTGNGEIKAASGYASLDVDIDLGSGADMDVVFDGVDLTENREGLIQITDINRLIVDTNNSSTVSVGFGNDVRTTYTLNGSNISKQVEGGRIELLDDRYSLVPTTAPRLVLCPVPQRPGIPLRIAVMSGSRVKPKPKRLNTSTRKNPLPGRQLSLGTTVS